MLSPFAAEPPEGESFGQAMILEPPNLLGAMWLQVLRGFYSGPTVRTCEECGNWFRHSPKARRKGRHCSDACRMKEQRSRKNDARQMHAAGMPIDKIAAKLWADEDTVERWVLGRKREEQP